MGSFIIEFTHLWWMIVCGLGSRDAIAAQRENGLQALIASITRSSRNHDGDAFDDDEGLVTEIASAVEHGVAVWSELKEKVYQRKMYSLLWAIRSIPRLIVTYDPWDLAWIKEEVFADDSGLAKSTAAEPCTTGPTNSLNLDGLSFAEQLVKQRMADTGVRRMVCPKCKSKEIERIAVQTRSADEGMTQMKQCTMCYHRWR